MRVTQHFGITGPVPFLDIHVERDNLLFLDPSAIRNSQADPVAARAHAQLVGFATEVLTCRRNSSTDEQERGRGLLRQLHEPNETRLGMSAVGVAGHAFGEKLGGRLWDELGINPACQTAALTRLEDLRVFVDGVGNDLVSDLATRVIYDVLADFTHRMTLRYPALAAAQTTAKVDLWDAAAAAWTPTAVTLPDVAPHPLLLVPKHWVRPRLLMSPYAFYNHFGTGTVQHERTRYTPQGRKVAPSKRELKAEFPHVRGLNNAQAAKYKRLGQDLVAEYRRQVDANYTPLDDDELDRRL